MIGETLALIGALFILLSAIGVLRFSDALSRMHALSKASTFGILLIFLGAGINLSDANDITSVALAAAVHLLTSPPASNMVSRAVYLAREFDNAVDVIDEGPAATSSAANQPIRDEPQ
jgi:multicomponent Na+:H+ antiporter subunit G